MSNIRHDLGIPGLVRLSSGKIRDNYHLDEEHSLIVTTDKISAFDVVLPDIIPGKGIILNRMSQFWKGYFECTIPNDLTGISVVGVLKSKGIKDEKILNYLEDRTVVVKRLKPLPVEAIVRGYLIGSGWKDYQNTGAICGIALPKGLQLADKLPKAIYTPSTKAVVGEHDENITFDATVDLLGLECAKQVRDISLQMYIEGAKYALPRGIIIADTKFEFGLDEDGVPHLIDEVLTPDSSRFWPASAYQPGTSPLSFDKQYVRDYLEDLYQQGKWDKKAPGPTLPLGVMQKTTEKYKEAEERLLYF